MMVLFLSPDKGIPMPTLKLLFTALFTLILLTPAVGQKRAPRAKPAPKTVAVQSASFDNLLSADTYKIYVEVRNVGQLINSSSFNEMLEPVIRLAAPPKEFRTAVKWLTAHADSVTTSRLMIATWPTAKNVPNVLVAIEFDTSEEAAKFEPQLNEVLRKVLPPTATPNLSPQGAGASPSPSPSPTAVAVAVAETKPAYFVMRSGSIVFVTSSPLTLKNLKPINAKPLTADPNFRMAYDRFTSESVFAFVNIKALEQEEKERREIALKQAQKEAEERAKSVGATPEAAPDDEEPVPLPEVRAVTSSTAVLIGGTEATPPPPDPMSIAMSQLAGAFFGGFGQIKWPDAIGFAGNLDASSFDVRALLITSQTEKPAAIPFFPALVSGPLFVPESPSILPSDTELFVTMSLDLHQVYAALTNPDRPVMGRDFGIDPTSETAPESPFAFIEKKLGMKLQEGLLPLLGSEVVFSMPVQSDASSKPSATPTPSAPAVSESAPSTSASSGPYAVRVTTGPSSRTPSPTIALSLKDKEGMRAFLPKLIEAIGFSGASALAQTERREDTEIVTYANALSYAFIGNFLVISPDVKNIKHVVDSYLKRETLSSDINFKNSTRWQPRQLHGQVYISPALMESYKKWANEPGAVINEQTREFLSRLIFTAEPVTYSLSNEGAGPLHQLRVPKNLLLMAVAGMSAETNPPPMVANERATLGALYFIAHTESGIRAEKGSYVSLDELIAQKKLHKGMLEGHGYRIEVNLVGDGFEATAVPIEYGKTGKMSFFINESGVIRGGDHAGAPATIADNPVQ